MKSAWCGHVWVVQVTVTWTSSVYCSISCSERQASSFCIRNSNFEQYPKLILLTLCENDGRQKLIPWSHFQSCSNSCPFWGKKEKKCSTYSSEVNTCQGLFKKRGSGDLRQFKCVFLWFAFPQFHLDYRAEETCLNGALKVVFFWNC